MPSSLRSGPGGCPPSAPGRPASRRRQRLRGRRIDVEHLVPVALDRREHRVGAVRQPGSRTTLTAAATASCTESESDPSTWCDGKCHQHVVSVQFVCSVSSSLSRAGVNGQTSAASHRPPTATRPRWLAGSATAPPPPSPAAPGQPFRARQQRQHHRVQAEQRQVEVRVERLGERGEDEHHHRRHAERSPRPATCGTSPSTTGTRARP